jgi:pilus assembly protein Flp/PilA
MLLSSRSGKFDIRLPRREKHMKLIWKLRLMKDTRGQDLIEYALMAGFVAVAAGAIMPGVAAQIQTIFGKVSSALAAAGS